MAGGAVFPLQDAAGQIRPVLAGSLSSQRPVPVAETKIPEPLPEFDLDNPQAIGIILAFHRWPDEDEQRIILEKTREAGLTKTEEIPRFKIWLFEWDEWRKAATAEKVCRSLRDLSFVEYCEPDSLLGPANADHFGSGQQMPIASRNTTYLPCSDFPSHLDFCFHAPERHDAHGLTPFSSNNFLIPATTPLLVFGDGCGR